MVKGKQKELRLSTVLIYSLLLNTGSSFMWPLTTVYMHNYLHESLTTAGIVLFAMSMFMIIGNYLGGYLFDHWSPYKTAIISVLITMASIVTLIFFHGWPIFGIMLLLYGLGNGSSMTLLNSYASMITSKSTRYVFNSLYVGLNLGVVVGTALVGFLMKYGISVVFIVATGFYIVLLLMTIFEFNIKLHRPVPTAVKRSEDDDVVQQKKNRGLKLIWLICIMVFCIYMSYTLWESVMSVHMTQLGISFENYSFLWTINGLLIVFIQPIINKIGSRFKMSRQIAFGVIIFGLSFFMLIFAKQYAVFVIIMVILTFGEMNGLPGIPAWIDTLADSRQKGKFQGLFNIFMSLGRAVGPLFGGLMVEFFNYPALFIVSGGLILLALFCVMREARKLSRTQKD